MNQGDIQARAWKLEHASNTRDKRQSNNVDSKISCTQLILDNIYIKTYHGFLGVYIQLLLFFIIIIATIFKTKNTKGSPVLFAFCPCRCCLLPSHQENVFMSPRHQCSRVATFALIETTHQPVPHGLDNHGSLTQVVNHACHLKMCIYTMEPSIQGCSVIADDRALSGQVTFG